jgi:arylsulfatase A-like enzyme
MGWTSRTDGERLSPSKRYRDRLEPSSVALDFATRPRILLWRSLAILAFLGSSLGILESTAGIIKTSLDRRIVQADLWVNWNQPWLAPFAMACLFLALGYPGLVLARLRVPGMSRLVPALLCGLGSWSAMKSVRGLESWTPWLVAAGAAVQAARWFALDRDVAWKVTRRAWPFAAMAWGALALAFGLIPAAREGWCMSVIPKAAPKSPNVILITLDTVRADRMSLYGWHRPTTPLLESWAKRGVRFDRAYATAPYTLATHASLFTGRWPFETSVRVGIGLDKAHRTIAETFRDRGYATGGFVANVTYCSARYGLDRGFLHYEDSPDETTRTVNARELVRSIAIGSLLLERFERYLGYYLPVHRIPIFGEQINSRALAWIDRRIAANRPFFAFLNFIDAHGPYVLPADEPQRFGKKSYTEVRRQLERLTYHEKQAEVFKNPESIALLPQCEDEFFDTVDGAYDDCLSYLDRQLDRLFHQLNSRGVLDHTIVIVTSDHGEMLGERRMKEHGHNVYDPLIHVPLLIFGPGVPNSRVIGDPVSVRDVPATLARLTGNAPIEVDGKSLERFWDDQAPRPPREVVFSQMEQLPMAPTPRLLASYGPFWSVASGPHVYIRQELSGGGVREELFDRDADPRQETNLATEPSLAETRDLLRADLERIRSGQGAEQLP